jgi:hypothetical protein
MAAEYTREHIFAPLGWEISNAKKWYNLDL